MPVWTEPRPGGSRELLRLAWPLIVSNGFMTLQLTIDRVFLSWQSSDALAATMPAVALFWTLFALPQNTVGYVTTFVAQYVGAGRPARVGPAVWQALYVALFGGIAFLGLIPLADGLIALGGHAEHLQELEATFLRCLCWSALPGLLVAAASGFFAGRGDSGTVMAINAVGLAVNALLDYALIFGNWGLPQWGIAGAGWATVAGSCASAAVGLALLFRACHRTEYQTVAGWRFDFALMGRLLRFGLPNGLQWCLDGVAFTLFILLIGRIGQVELAATNIALTLNLLAFLPTMGIGQAVAVLVGQRQGEGRPDLAERTTWTGFRLGWLAMAAVASLYVFVPDLLYELFRSKEPGEQTAAVAALVPELLRFVAVYCLFDSMNLVFSFALRGAGDTRYVTVASLVFSWSIMVVPAWATSRFDGALYWAWTFATVYIAVLGVVLLFRFWGGRWKTMRVIEAAVVEEALEPQTATAL